MVLFLMLVLNYLSVGNKLIILIKLNMGVEKLDENLSY